MFKHQRARLAWSLPIYTSPTVSAAPYLAPELQVGDLTDFVNSSVAAVFPTPTITDVVFLGSTSRGNTPYTISSGDVGGSLTVKQVATNNLGVDSKTSTAVTPIALQRAWDQNILGGNCGGATDYSRNQFLNNAGQAGFPFYAYQSGTVAYSGGYDGSGWPTAAFTLLVSAAIGVPAQDGQIVAGSYQCSYRSVSQATPLTGAGGCTISNITNISPVTGSSDGVTTYFTMVVPTGANVSLNFNGAVQYVNVPRDFVTETWGGPEFWPVMLAHYSQESTVRPMDICAPNCTEKLWSDMPAQRIDNGSTSPGLASGWPNCYSWGRIARLMIAIAGYSGSRTKKFHIAIPGLIDPSATNSNNYAYQLVRYLDSQLSGHSFEIEIEVADEPWNATLAGGIVFSANLHGAQTETKSISLKAATGTYTTDGNPVVSSVISNGDGTVTVTLGSSLTGSITGTTLTALTASITGAPLIGQTLLGLGVTPGTTITGPQVTVDGTHVSFQVSATQVVSSTTLTTAVPCNAIPNNDGSGTTFSISNGDQMVVNNATLNSTWGAGSVVQNANPLLAATVTTVAVTVSSPTGNTFIYPQAVGGALTSGTVCPATQMAFFFNTNSSLILDGLGLNLYNMCHKAHTRRLYQVSQIWKVVRPQDNWVMNLQTYAQSGSIQVQYPYAQYIGGSLTPWAYASAVAPYVQPIVTGAKGTAGNAFLTNVSFVSTAQVGDTISIAGAGTAGAALVTTVATGSTGTTLNLATTVVTTVTNATITAVSGPTATFSCYIVGTAMTSTSGTPVIGMIFNSCTTNVFAPGTKILSGAGTSWVVSVSQTFASSGSPASVTAANTDGIVGMMAAAIATNTTLILTAHIYQCLRFGLRPMCYEGGPGTELQPTQQIAIHTNPLIGPVVTSLYDAWFGQGGKEFQAYWLAPSTITNSQEGAWPYLQSFTDVTSPKYAAHLAYATHTLTYSNSLGTPGTWGPGGTAGAYTQNIVQGVASGTNFNTINGMVFSTSTTVDRFIDILFTIPRSRRYKVLVVGSSNTADLLDIYVNSALVGQVTLVANGNGSTNGTVPGASAPLLVDVNGSNVPYFTSGACTLRVDTPVGRALNWGVFSVQLLPY